MALYYFMHSPTGSESGYAAATQGKAKVLQFSQAMCYDCKRIEKEIAPLRTDPQYKTITFQKVDVSSGTPTVQQLVRQYNVDVVPTLVFFDKNGTVQGRIQGYVPQSQIKGYLDRIK